MAGWSALPLWVTAHWQLKLLSLGFAIFLWIFVASEEKAETVVSVPIEFGRIPPGLEIVSSDNDSVDVRVHGLRSVLNRLDGRGLRVTVDLREARPGETTVRLLPEQVQAPRGIQVLRVTPSRVRLQLRPSPATGSPATSQLSGPPAPRDLR